MGTGILRIDTFLGDHALPVKDCKVVIKSAAGSVLHELFTDENGTTDDIFLQAPDKTIFEISTNTKTLFSSYDVEVTTSMEFKNVHVKDVQIFDGISSLLPVQVHPKDPDATDYENIEIIVIPWEHGVDFSRDEFHHGEANCTIIEDGTRRELFCNPNGIQSINTQNYQYPDTPAYLEPYVNHPLANEVAIPKYITVHLGSPNAVAENVRVPFIDYIKNVASSEIFPFWEKAALYANIYAQISFALNRVYTVWYRSQGKDFDITNNTAFDQFFVYGRNIFSNISEIVDNIFNVFIRRQGRREPFFASYCSGTTVTCPGLSQYGSQDLAKRGYSAMEILLDFYPSDINLVESNNFASTTLGAFPGYSLKEGMSGEDVRKMQTYLNRISGNWYIPNVGRPDGIYGTATKNAVTEFQKIFKLTPDGIIGKSTWYQIIRIYVAAKQLGELSSEGERIGIGTTPPTSTIQSDSRGEDVIELQFLLNFISEFFPVVPFVVQNGVFRDETKRSVIEFQKAFGLTPDGIVGPGTWRKLYDVFNLINSNIEIPPVTPEPPISDIPAFPGYPLRLGSSGSNVSLMQNYLNAIAKVYNSIPNLAVDGIFGSRTHAAVAEFQRLFGLAADGIIGQITWYRIVDVYNSITMGQTPPFPGTDLRLGSRGNDVLTMQEHLNRIARVFPLVPSQSEDGIFGTGMQNTVIAFQNLFGLTTDGIIGKNTWNKIVYVNDIMPDIYAPTFPGTPLRVGARGNNVIIVQNYLNTLARYYPTIPSVTVDGVFGNATEEAVKAFQNTFELASDGIVGQITWNTLVSLRNMYLMNESDSRVVSVESVRTRNSDNQSGFNPALFMALGLMRR